MNLSPLKIYLDAVAPANGEKGFFDYPPEFKNARPEFFHELRLHLLQSIVPESRIIDAAIIVETPQEVIERWKAGETACQCGMSIEHPEGEIEGFGELMAWYVLEGYIRLFELQLAPPEELVLDTFRVLNRKARTAFIESLKTYQAETPPLASAQIPIMAVFLISAKIGPQIRKICRAILAKQRYELAPVLESIEKDHLPLEKQTREQKEKIFVYLKCSAMTVQAVDGKPLWYREVNDYESQVEKIFEEVIEEAKQLDDEPEQIKQKDLVPVTKGSTVLVDKKTRQGIKAAAKASGMTISQFVESIPEEK